MKGKKTLKKYASVSIAFLILLGIAVIDLKKAEEKAANLETELRSAQTQLIWERARRAMTSAWLAPNGIEGSGGPAGMQKLIFHRDLVDDLIKVGHELIIRADGQECIFTLDYVYSFHWDDEGKIAWLLIPVGEKLSYTIIPAANVEGCVSVNGRRIQFDDLGSKMGRWVEDHPLPGN